MPHAFGGRSIAFKLNVVQGVWIVLVILIATVLTTGHLRGRLDADALENLKQTNRQVVSMLEAYDRNLRAEVERLGRVFASPYDAVEPVATAGAPKLAQRGLAISDHSPWLETFSKRSGAVATILVRQGDDFVRGASSLAKEDGTPASGTPLGGEHPARAALVAGRDYTGVARLFGRDYMTHYQPAKDAAGKVVGAFFVGVELTESLKALKAGILKIKIGQTGYVYAMEAGKNAGVLTIHPAKEGSNLIDAKASNGFLFVREMLERKSGVIRYDWANPGESAAREKIVVYDHYAGWDWLVATGSYTEEFISAANLVTRDVAIMALFIVASALLSGLLATRHWVTRPLEGVVAEAKRIAAGDLTGNLRPSSGDEVGRLTSAIAGMADNLKSMLGEIRAASQTILDRSLALASAAEQVSKGSHAQSDAATGMAASVEQVSVSIDQVAQHARDASRISASAGETAREGGGVIQAAVAAMSQIAGSVHESSTTVVELGERSQEISKVVQVIKEIADQTNLLALNAAIEAARAGEQGRGFAVVADEVRQLAERTAKSTRSIGEMIVSIQDGATAAVNRMKDGVAQVEKGSVLADRAGVAIGGIDTSTGEVIRAVGSISEAIGEQSTATQTIAQGVEQIAQMAEANHAASRDTADAANALSDMAKSLDHSLQRFRVA